MSKITRVLPLLNDYLKILDSFEFNEYPCLCQDSSIILYAWLKKHGIDCQIIAGYHIDPIKKHDTIHFWIETKDTIVDGTAVQFLLDSYEGTKCYKDIEHLIAKTSFYFKDTDRSYNSKVVAYIHKKLQIIIEKFICNTRNSFQDYMLDVKQIYDEKYRYIVEFNQYMMFSSLYKIDSTYYNLSYHEFINKCIDCGIKDKISYIIEY